MNSSTQKCVILFADLASGAASANQAGAPDSARSIQNANAEVQHSIERGMKRVLRAIEGFNGKIIRCFGSEVLALYPSADDAFHSACEMRWRVSLLPPVLGAQLAVRVGFHFGQASVDGTNVYGEGADAAASLVALAGDGQILVSSQTLEALSPQLQQVMVPADLPDSCNAGLSIFIAQCDANTVAELTRRPVPVVAKPRKRLLLSYSGKDFWLDSKTDSIKLGRDPGNDIVIADRRASRLHATINRRGDYFVLCDVSTNGTIVALDGATEQLIKQSEMILTSRGRFVFAHVGGNTGTETVTFEIKD